MKLHLFPVAAICCAISFADTTPAAGQCGPHAYVRSSHPKPQGGIFYNCTCVRGYRPITTAVTGVPNPGCVPAPRVARPAAPERRTGAYRAEPAAPPSRGEAPPAETRKPAAELGATTSVEQAAPSREPPVPHLAPNAWSDAFPSEKSPAAFPLQKDGLDRLREAHTRSVEWFREKAREKALEVGFEQIPKGDWVNSIREKAKDMAELFKGMKASATEYVNGIFSVTNQELGCIASARLDCGRGGLARLERNDSKYASRESERWKSWLKKELEP